MIRACFIVPDTDYRPVVWPVQHPYWCTAQTPVEHSVVVAYVDDAEELARLWPDAYHIDLSQTEATYVFTSRFPKPTWWVAQEEAKRAAIQEG